MTKFNAKIIGWIGIITIGIGTGAIGMIGSKGWYTLIIGIIIWLLSLYLVRKRPSTDDTGVSDQGINIPSVPAGGTPAPSGRLETIKQPTTAQLNKDPLI